MEKRDKDYFDKLYKGLSVEYYVISNLMYLGYEAYKMPADFGFDITALRQKQSSFEDEKNRIKIIQVKSRVINEKDNEDVRIDKNENNEKKIMITRAFYIKCSDFDIIAKEKSAYTIFYFVEKRDDMFCIPCYFWLSSRHLKCLKKYNYINLNQKNKENNDEQYFLTAKMIIDLESKISDFKKIIESDEKNSCKYNEIITKASSIQNHTHVVLNRYEGNKIVGQIKLPSELYDIKSLDAEVVLNFDAEI